MRALLATGRAARDAGDLGAAGAAFEQVLQRRERVYADLARTGLATVRRLEGQPWAALQLLEQVVAVRAPQATPELALLCERELHEEAARCYLDLGVFDRAQRHLAELRQLVQGDAVEPARVELAAVELLLGQGEYGRARRAVAAAFERWSEAAAAAGIELDLRLCGLLAAQRPERDPGALRGIAAELEQLPAVGLRASKCYRARFDAALAWQRAGDLDRAAALLPLLRQDAGDVPLARAEVTALAARLALAGPPGRADVAGHRAALRAAIDRWFDAWRAMPLRGGGTGMLAFADRRDVIATMLELDRLGGGNAAFAAAFNDLEASLALGSVSRRVGARSPSLAAVRADLVPPDGGILMYAMARSGTHLLAIDADGQVHESVPFDEQLLQDVFELAAAIDRAPATDDAAPLRSRAQRLADRLLTPAIRARVDAWRQVLLVGDQHGAAALHLLPWGRSWLALERELRHVPSLALLTHLQRRAAAAVGRATDAVDLAVIGDPAHGAAAARRWGVQPLALRPDQRRRLLAPFATDRVVAEWGAAATPAALWSEPVAAARAVAVVAHGVHEYTRELHDGVLLAAAGGDAGAAVFADDVVGRRVAPLAILAVCGAAGGPLRIGDDGPGHLGGAMLAAGADAVVSASGDLPVDATVALVAAMLDELRQGARVAAALQQARVAIAADPRRAHPYWFAGLRLCGLDVAPWR